MKPLGAKYSPAPWVGNNYTDFLCVYSDMTEVCYQDQIEDEAMLPQMMRDFWTSVGRRDIKCE